MSVDAIGGSGEAQAAGGWHHHHRGEMLGKVADALGMDKKDLLGQLRQGSSLADIAQSKGVGRDELVEMIKAALPPQAADAAGLAERIADRKGLPSPPPGQAGPPPGPPAGGFGGPGDVRQLMSKIATALGTDATDLVKQLRDGGSLAEVAASKGVSRDQLLATIKQSLASQDDDSLTQLAAKIADHTDQRPSAAWSWEAQTRTDTYG